MKMQYFEALSPVARSVCYFSPFSAFVFSFLNFFLGTERSLFGEMAYSSVPLIGASLLDTTRYLEDPIALFVLYYFAKGTKFEITGTLVLSVVFGGALGYLLGASLGIVVAWVDNPFAF